MHYLWCTRTWGITYSKDEKAEPNTTQIYANAIHPLDPNKEQGFTVLGEIQEAIFEEKIFRIFSTKKSSFILAGTSKQDYIWISY